ncbi:hypothetical protein Ahy_B06g081444 isoform B [Arachis hypogaea]|uniref:Uncharacterized protein n=1 Tax=Arachis hypogaea TaxID=3818 RepID=A0A444YL11_ARAHY|nr:hypothetical protein Ahy_B06g081444 isoform B [Arachis hypogaea]
MDIISDVDKSKEMKPPCDVPMYLCIFLTSLVIWFICEMDGIFASNTFAFMINILPSKCDQHLDKW